MLIAGVDYSMTCPCICVGDSKATSFDDCQLHYLIDNKRYAGKFGKNITGHLYVPSKVQIQRFIDIATWSYSILKDCKHVMIEDYSMGSKGKVFHIAENTAMLKYTLHTNNLQWAAYPPTSLKKFACGKGNADKQAMYEQFTKESTADLKGLYKFKGKKVGNPISDIVDSYYLFKYLSSTTAP